MPRYLRHDVHPLNPQARLLQQAALQLRAGAVLALPSAAGYVLACRPGDKAASARLQRCAGADDRAPPTLLCRDLAQAALHLQVDDRAFRLIRHTADAGTAFALRASRAVPRRLVAGSGGVALLQFAGHAASQGVLALLDEPLLVAQPPGLALGLDDLPERFQAALDAALDAGPLPGARPLRIADPAGLLQARPALSRWLGAVPALA